MALWIALVALLFALLALAPAVAASRLGRASAPASAPRELEAAVGAIRRRAHGRVALGVLAVVTAGLGAALGPWLRSWAQLALPIVLLTAITAGSLAVAALSGGPGPRSLTGSESHGAGQTARTGGLGPGWALPLPVVLGALLAGVASWAASHATIVDGQPALSWQADGGSGWLQPYPGWAQALPMLIGVGVALAAYLLALRRVSGWPRPSDEGLHDLDDDVRRATVRMLLVGVSGGLAAALGSLVTVIAGTWGAALVNQRSAVDQPSQAGVAEIVAGGAHLSGLLMLVLGLLMMCAAAAAGYVRDPEPRLEVTEYARRSSAARAGRDPNPM